MSIPLGRLKFVLCALLLAAAAALVASPAEAAEAKPDQVRLIWRDSPSTTATVSWNTPTAGSVHRVHYHAADDDSVRGTVESAHNGEYHGLFFHHARLTGLKPDTKYALVIESDGAVSRPYYFITAPEGDKPFKLLFGGDSRSGLEDRKRMNRMLAKMLYEQPEILALVHGGDYIATGRNFSQWLAWMRDHELTTAADGRLLPIIPARGNHDGGKLFDQIFGFPSSSGNYYGLSFGSLLRLVTLNTEISMAGDQAQWLEDELAAHRPDHRWLVAQYHRPAYPAVKAPSGALANWVPLFERYNVDLVYEADGHAIKRTVPIRNNEFDPSGVTYIGEGGLGVAQRAPSSSRWYLRPPAKAGQGHHVHLLSFSPEKLQCEAVLLGGEVFDSHTLSPRD